MSDLSPTFKRMTSVNNYLIGALTTTQCSCIFHVNTVYLLKKTNKYLYIKTYVF